MTIYECRTYRAPLKCSSAPATICRQSVRARTHSPYPASSHFSILFVRCAYSRMSSGDQGSGWAVSHSLFSCPQRVRTELGNESARRKVTNTMTPDCPQCCRLCLVVTVSPKRDEKCSCAERMASANSTAQGESPVNAARWKRALPVKSPSSDCSSLTGTAAILAAPPLTGTAAAPAAAWKAALPVKSPSSDCRPLTGTAAILAAASPPAAWKAALPVRFISPLT